MCSRFDRLRRAGVALCGLVATAASAGPPMTALLEAPPPAHVAVPPGRLRVCADPNNLPFSNRREQGFENAIAQIVGRETKRRVEYTWWPQRRGFVRKTLRAGLCDVVIGVPAHYALTDTTPPYYASTYVFVVRGRRGIASFADPALAGKRIGVTTVGDDYANTPPAQALAERGLARNVVGYSIYGDYSQPDPPRALIDAVARGEVDVAVAWGPLAGYFASRQPVPLTLTPVADRGDPGVPRMTYAIAMGVRKGDDALKSELTQALARRHAEIEGVLRRYRVPLVPVAAAAAPGG